jgi:hypothetical protein
MTACAICRRTAPDGQHACPLHASELRAWLAELPRQAQLLEEFVAPAGRPTQGRLGGTGRAHAPVPVDLRVLALLAPGHPGPVGDPTDDTDDTVPILALLAAWAGHIAYTYPAAHRDPHGTAHTAPCEQAWPSNGATITGWCAWLTAYLPYTLTLQVVGELHRQLEALLARIRDLTHAVPHRHRKTGPCPACTEWALVQVDGRTGITCEACGHHLSTEDYQQHIQNTLHDQQAS